MTDQTYTKKDIRAAMMIGGVLAIAGSGVAILGSGLTVGADQSPSIQAQEVAPEATSAEKPQVSYTLVPDVDPSPDPYVQKHHYGFEVTHPDGSVQTDPDLNGNGYFDFDDETKIRLKVESGEWVEVAE
jgi:hypothetical protein